MARETYPKTSSGDSTNQYGDGALRSDSKQRVSGGSGYSSGPTGSSRSYPKGSRINMSADFNPQKHACTDIYVGGI